jgi:hypothetical protein
MIFGLLSLANLAQKPLFFIKLPSLIYFAILIKIVKKKKSKKKTQPTEMLTKDKHYKK